METVSDTNPGLNVRTHVKGNEGTVLAVRVLQKLSCVLGSFGSIWYLAKSAPQLRDNAAHWSCESGYAERRKSTEAVCGIAMNDGLKSVFTKPRFVRLPFTLA